MVWDLVRRGNSLPDRVVRRVVLLVRVANVVLVAVSEALAVSMLSRMYF